jgi:hypothetical protein
MEMDGCVLIDKYSSSTVQLKILLETSDIGVLMPAGKLLLRAKTVVAEDLPECWKWYGGGGGDDDGDIAKGDGGDSAADCGVGEQL